MLELPDEEELVQEYHPTRQEVEQWRATPPRKPPGKSKRKLAERESAQYGSAKSAKHSKHGKHGRVIDKLDGGRRTQQATGPRIHDQGVENMIRSIICNTCNKPVGSSEDWLIHIHQSARKVGSEEKHNLMCLCCGEAFQSFKLLRCHILRTRHVTPKGKTTARTEQSMRGENCEEAVDNNEDGEMDGDDEGEEGYRNIVKWKERGGRLFQREPSIFRRMQAIPGPRDGTFLRRFLGHGNQGLLAEDLEPRTKHQKLPAEHLNIGAKSFGSVANRPPSATTQDGVKIRY